jgi:hypothetical protein
MYPYAVLQTRHEDGPVNYTGGCGYTCACNTDNSHTPAPTLTHPHKSPYRYLERMGAAPTEENIKTVLSHITITNEQMRVCAVDALLPTQLRPLGYSRSPVVLLFHVYAPNIFTV